MLRIRLALLSATLALVACNDATTTSPPVITNFDARHALSKIDPLAAVLDQPIYRSFNGALSSFEVYFRTAPVGPPIAVRTRIGAFDARLTRALAPSTEIRASAIPNNVQGKTFVWNVDTRTYIADAAAAGAPANGVRFLLYAWDVLNGPTIPLNRIGYVDIFPAEGAAAGKELTELFVVRDVPRLPVADFVVMHSTTAGIDNFGIEGSATDGFTVDIIDLTGSQSGAAGQHHLVYNTSLSSSPPAVSAVEQLTSDQATGSQGGRLELSYEGHKLTDESVAAGAEVTFDGGLYARVIFPPTVDAQTQYLRADGTSLSQQEIADLNALLERTIVANFFWIALAYP